MIFVCVGSRKYPFDRLFVKLDKMCENGEIKDEIFAQIGTSTYKPKRFKYKDFLSPEEFQEKINEADIVITHGASGSIMKALNAGKKVIAVTRLKKYGDYDFFKNIQVLTPTKKGTLGTKELNISLQSVLNPEEENKLQKKIGDRFFRVGDRVMQVKNNYDIFWEKENENGTGIFNGEIGRVENIDDVNKTIKIIFDDDKKAWYEFSELEQIEHSYCITIHKSQR